MVIGVYHGEPEEMTVPKRYPGPGSNRRAYAFIRSCKAYRCGHQLRAVIHEKKMKKKGKDGRKDREDGRGDKELTQVMLVNQGVYEIDPVSKYQ